MRLRTQDVRPIVFLIAFTDTIDPAAQLLRQHARSLTNTTETYAWIHGPLGWRLSAASLKRLDLHRAGLKLAVCELALSLCIGIRCGRGVAFLGGLYSIMQAVLSWPHNVPANYSTFHQEKVEYISLDILWRRMGESLLDSVSHHGRRHGQHSSCHWS